MAGGRPWFRIIFSGHWFPGQPLLNLETGGRHLVAGCPRMATYLNSFANQGGTLATCFHGGRRTPGSKCFLGSVSRPSQKKILNFLEFLLLSGRRPLQSSRSRRVIDPKRIFVPNGATSVELCPFPFKNLDFRPESELRGRNLSCGC